MDNIDKKRAQRYLYLKRVYELSEGDELQYFPFVEIGTQLGWDEETNNQVTTYLLREGLINFPRFGRVSITHNGVKQVENAVSHPDQPTEYFPKAGIIVLMANGDITIGGDVIGHDKTTGHPKDQT